ncbi:MAG: hypothetical protein KGN31_07105 [Betaproteobacteria bacterium]|nr:hypothetical protein [Betaproteobacteria bacterium]
MRISEFLSDSEKLKLAELIFSKVFGELTGDSSNKQPTVMPNTATANPTTPTTVNKPITKQPTTPLQRINNRANIAQQRKAKPIVKPIVKAVPKKAIPKRIPNAPQPKPLPQPKPQAVTPTQYKQQQKKQNQSLAKEIGKSVWASNKAITQPINPILPDRFNTATSKIDGEQENRLRNKNL